MFFFFQAEDGIRDDLVTGVQTCALPIFIMHADHSRIAPVLCWTQNVRHSTGAIREWSACMMTHKIYVCRHPRHHEIGRASCRERVYTSGSGVGLKNKKGRTDQ